MMNKGLNKIFVFLFLSLPFLAEAQTFRSIFGLLGRILANYFIPLLGALVIAFFVYGIVKFIFAGGDENKIKDAKMYIIVGLTALFFLIAFWALIQVLMNTFFGGMPSMPGGFPPEFF